MSYSFTCDLENCPKCDSSLTGDMTPPTILVIDGDNQIETSIGGDDGNFFRSYILANSGTLILENRAPLVQCSYCNLDLSEFVTSEEEV